MSSNTPPVFLDSISASLLILLYVFASKTNRGLKLDYDQILHSTTKAVSLKKHEKSKLRRVLQQQQWPCRSNQSTPREFRSGESDLNRILKQAGFDGSLLRNRNCLSMNAWMSQEVSKWFVNRLYITHF